jgi:4'-phosphopantetheinyl transferase EntD
VTVLARDGTLHALLPPGVAVCTESDPTAAEPLFPSEQAAIRDAVASRQREFALGRTCARRALRRLGAEACPIGVGTMREPVWPEGIVGSITHCASFWAAAVARRAELRGLGIDVADNRPLEPAVRNLIAAGGDEAALMESADPDVAWDVVLFSVKEAVFKAWWPVHRWSPPTFASRSIEPTALSGPPFSLTAATASECCADASPWTAT